MRQAPALASCVCLVGCSLFVRDVPDGWEPSRDPECTSSTTLVTADAVIALPGALAIVVGLLGIAADRRCSKEIPETMCWIGLGGLVWTVPWTISGLSGERKVERCKQAEAQHRAWQPPSPRPPTAPLR